MIAVVADGGRWRGRSAGGRSARDSDDLRRFLGAEGVARLGADLPALLLLGRVWPGGDADVIDDGAVLLGDGGTVLAMGARGELGRDVGREPSVLTCGGPTTWIGPGIADAHVHLAFEDPAAGTTTGVAAAVVAARDLGAPLPDALRMRAEAAPRRHVEIAGELVTAPGGYPSRSWGADGFARFVADDEQAVVAVDALATAGVDVVKLALEPRGGPVPSPEVARAVVATAHARGLRVVAHALTVEMVERALAAGADELVHTPTERLPAGLVDRLAASGTAVTSTLWTFVAGGDGTGALANARAFVAAGVPLLYGTDLGNAGTRPGPEPRELELLAEAGLGRVGALRAATGGWPGSPYRGRLEIGHPGRLVLLADDPLQDPEAWRRPVVVVAGGSVLL